MSDTHTCCGITLVTGANGYIGSATLSALMSIHRPVRGAMRTAPSATPAFDHVVVGNLANNVDWTEALKGVDVVVHTAGLAHTAIADPKLAIESYNRINRVATIALASSALTAGVKRFIFVSSVGVYGQTNGGHLDEQTVCAPSKPYAVSKLAAEQDLQTLSACGAMEVTILRPPMVYGADCPGNFSRLVRLINTGLPLPLGSIGGSRNFVSVNQLATLISLASTHQGDASGIFNAGESVDLTVPEVIQAIADGLGKANRTFRFPPESLATILKLVGKHQLVEKLQESILINSSKARTVFKWSPSPSTLPAMREAARALAC